MTRTLNTNIIKTDVLNERVANENRPHRHVCEYLEAFVKLKESERVIIVDGNRSKQEIADDIWDKIKPYLAD